MRRALVVDDSKLARVALKRQLEQYDISVETADSGEEALDFLKHDIVDVIFMDHVMPGMDGLSAVKELKENPRTATIPVMMYTSKEGELYVSQARALGAVDVLPKQVQPGVLFGMLLKLGLVRDRRRPAVGAYDSGPDQPTNGHGASAEEQAMGTPLPSLVDRILEDQRSAMRSDLMSTQRNFAQYVANEVYERQRADREAEEQRRGQTARRLPWAVATVSALLAIAFIGLFLAEREAQVETATVTDEAAQPRAEIESQPAGATVEPLESFSPLDRDRLIESLVWAINESGPVPFASVPFDNARAFQISSLLERLLEAGFEGTLLVESHLGAYCLDVDANGLYIPAPPDRLMAECAMVGHPLDDSPSLAARQTPGFEANAAFARMMAAPGIDLEIIAHDRMTSTATAEYPSETGLAGDWNAIAAMNNRIEYTLIPR